MTLCTESSSYNKHDEFSEAEVSSSPWDRNAAYDMSNVPTGPVTHSKSKGQNLTAEGFVIMSEGVNWLMDGWKNVLRI